MADRPPAREGLAPSSCVDASAVSQASTELIRPAPYGGQHSAHALPAKTPAGQAGRGHWAATVLLDTDLEGPVCESTDSFGRHALPPTDRGDLVAIEEAGAYGASLPPVTTAGPRWQRYCCGSMARCSHAKAPITPVAPTPARAPCSAARSARPEACHTVGSATVTKESLP